MRRVLKPIGLFLVLPALLLAAAPMSTQQLVDGAGVPIGTDASPLVARLFGSPLVQDMPSREVAARQGAYYVFTTGSAGDFQRGGLAVSNGQFLNARICNVSTTQRAFITKRILDSSATVAVPYGGVASPAALTAANTNAYAGTPTNGSNIIVGGAASSAVQVSFGVGTSVVNNATANAQPTGVGFVYPGFKNELDELRILPPGTCFGQYINGLPTTLGTSTIFLGIRFYAYVEPASGP